MTSLHGELRKRIDSLEVLPATVGVAMRCIELGKNGDAGVEEYTSLIEADPALSGKILAVTNSSWFGVARRVTTIKQAVGLLGTASVRALAVSYCLAGLHNAWRLDPEDGRAFWEASLSKAIASRRVAQALIPELADEAFTMGLFQDIGIGMFAAVGGRDYVRGLRNARLSVSGQISDELERFGLDHAACGRLIGDRLCLPPLYVVAIELHHRRAQLAGALDDEGLAVAGHVAALFPHDIRAWKPDTLPALEEVVASDLSAHWADIGTFVREVQAELEQLEGLLSLGAAQPPSLVELLERACLNSAQATTELVDHVQGLRSKNDTLSSTVDTLETRQRIAEHRATHDALTGLLNRDGFHQLTREAIGRAAQAGRPVAVALFDLDGLKSVNDSHGHGCGDAVLQTLGERLRRVVDGDVLVCRWGGDEIVVFIQGAGRQECLEAIRSLKQAVQAQPVPWREHTVPILMSGGLHWLESVGETDVSALVEPAGQALYQAKLQGRHGLVLANETPAAPSVPS